MKLVSDAYFEQLESGTSDDAKIARDYLAQRGIDDENRERCFGSASRPTHGTSRSIC